MARKQIGEFLLEAGVITQETLQVALDEQRRWGGPIGRVMIDRGLITEDGLVAALAAQFRLPVVEVNGLVVPQEALDLIPAELAVQHNVLPVRLERKSLDLAMSDPTQMGVIDEIQMRALVDVNPVLAGPHAIENAIRRLYPNAPRKTVSMSQPVMAVPPPASTGTSQPSIAVPRVSRSMSATGGAAAAGDEREREFRNLQKRVQALEGLLQRDEDVIRRLCLLLIDKQVVTRDEITKKLSG